jgi:hypothetical protein
MTVDPREHLSGRWTEDVWMGLKVFVETDLEDLDGLRCAIRSLPEDEAEHWLELMSTLEEEDQRRRVEGEAPDTRFCHLLRGLNREWFLPRNLVLIKTSRRGEQGHTDMWDLHGVGVAIVVHAISFLIGGTAEGEGRAPTHRGRHAVTAYNVRWVFPNGLGVGFGQYDASVPGVVLHLDGIDATARSMGTAIPQSPQALRGRVLPHTRTSWINGWREYGEFHRRRYPDGGVASRALLGLVRALEVRDAMNHARASLAPDELPDTNAEWLAYFERLAERLLSPGGSARRRLWWPEPPAEDEEGDDNERPGDAESMPAPMPPAWRERIDRARRLSRLSAELTAAAVAPDPLLSVAEWTKELKIFAGETRSSGQSSEALLDAEFAVICGHADLRLISAMIWAVALLAEELGWEPRPSLRDPTHGDVCLAAELAPRLQAQVPGALRLALKAIYACEFNAPIDESPFATIDGAGNVQPRFPGEGKVDRPGG